MIIQPANRISQVKEYYFSSKLREIAEMKARGLEILNLGIGSPDLPPEPAVVDALNSHSQNGANHAYQSYRGIPELREAFAKWYKDSFNAKLDPAKEILPLIGSKEGIMHIAMTFLEEGDVALVPNPGYPAYSAVSKLAGARVKAYELREENDWLPDLKALQKKDLSRVKIMWVNYPNMPTGAKANRVFFKKLIKFAKKHKILVCNDNPYSFILNDHPSSILSLPGAKDVAIELNSLSKSHNMAGWRVGMLAGKAEYLDEIIRFKSNMDSGMFRPLQLAAVKALSAPPSWYKRLNKIYEKRRKKAFKLLDMLDCTYSKEQVGMFIWAKVPARYSNGFEMSDDALYKSQVFLTPGGIFGSKGDPYIRISLCSDISLYEKAIEKLVNSNFFEAQKLVG